MSCPARAPAPVAVPPDADRRPPYPLPSTADPDRRPQTADRRPQTADRRPSPRPRICNGSCVRTEFGGAAV
ncbi:hypothetical protein EAD89_25415 [Micromonospora sp. BL4]|nr:hypothetical protein EAD89_25415 [Micromonospora sp. BL4]